MTERAGVRESDRVCVSEIERVRVGVSQINMIKLE